MGQPTIQFQDVLLLINNLQAQLNALKQSSLPAPSTSTAGSFVIVSAGGGSYALLPLTGDVVSSNSTPGATTVASISSLIPLIRSTQNNSPYQILSTITNTTAVNAALGDNCYLNLTANTTVAAPTNPRDGQILTFLLNNNSMPQTVNWNAVFTFAGNSAPAITGSSLNIVAFKYNATLAVWTELYRALGQLAPQAFYFGPPPPIGLIRANWSPWLRPIPPYCDAWSLSVPLGFPTPPPPPIGAIISNWTPRQVALT